MLRVLNVQVTRVPAGSTRSPLFSSVSLFVQVGRQSRRTWKFNERGLGTASLVGGRIESVGREAELLRLLQVAEVVVELRCRFFRGETICRRVRWMLRRGSLSFNTYVEAEVLLLDRAERFVLDNELKRRRFSKWVRCSMRRLRCR